MRVLFRSDSHRPHYPLAVFAPTIGALSETFIQRHINALLPGRTIAVADTDGGQLSGHWSADCPSLILRRAQASGIGRKLPRAVAYALGRPNPGTNRTHLVQRFLKLHRAEVVMSEYLDWSWRWLHATTSLSVPFFVHAHGYDVSQMLRSPEWVTKFRDYNDAAGVFTVSQSSRERLLSIGLEPGRVHVIPCGVDVPGEATPHLETDIVRCLAVGRMVAKKGPILTLDAFRRAAGAVPRLRLDYVGEGDLLPAAQQFVRVSGLESRVTLHGGQRHDKVLQLMKKADIFIQHSVKDPLTGDEEGLPVAMLEAMAHGLPVVATRHAGIPEAVEEGVTGYLVDEWDTAGMADRLIALARSPDARHRLGTAGWMRVKETFSWEREREGLLRALGLQSPRESEEDGEDP